MASASTTTSPLLEYHPASSAVHLLACSIITFCFARRFTWKHLTLNRLCALAIFLDSWVFVFWGGLVATGIGMSKSPGVCLTGIYLCISFYGSSKVLTYLFLADRVYIVWSANNPVSRRKSKIWMLCGVVLLGYVVCFALMLIAKIAYIRSDGNCVIGLEGEASIPLLVYDSFLNIFLTTLFAWPILRRKISNPKLRSLAKRTCFAATVSLSVSVWNVVFLLLRDGRRLGWVCIASCAFDVTVNAIAIYFITQNPHGPKHSAPQASPETGPAASPPLPPPPSDREDSSSESGRNQETRGSRKFRLPSFKGLVSPHFPAFSHRHGRKDALPIHHPSEDLSSACADTQDASKSFSLSKIGHFAVTQDNPGGVMTRKEAMISSDDNGRKFTVDLRSISREETTTILKPLSVSSSSDQDRACPPGKRDSSGSGLGLKSKLPGQIGAQCAEPTRQHGRDSPNVVGAISIPDRDTSNFNSSTWTNEFDATGTKIEFRNPLDVDEDQDGIVNEDLNVAIPPPSRQNYQRRWSSEMTINRKSGAFILGTVEEHPSFPITEDGDNPKQVFRAHGIAEGHR